METQATRGWDIEIQRHRATLLNYLLLAATVAAVPSITLVYVTAPESTSPLGRLAIVAPFVACWLIVLIAWIWRGLDYRIRASTVVLLSYAVSVIVFARGGLAGSGRVWLLLPPVLAFVLIGPRTGIVGGGISVLTYLLFVLAISQGWVVPQVAEDLNSVAPMATEGGSFLLVVVVLTVILWAFNRGWLEALFGVGTAQHQLEAQARELEERNERLRRQATQLRATADIARTGVSILDLEQLLEETVRRVDEAFSPMGVHHVGLFLIDEARQSAVLRAATGEAGRLLLETGHKLAVDEASTVGRCIVHRQARITLDMGEGPAEFGSLALSLTRSEIALPLRSRGQIMGAMSVQSTREAAFAEDDVATLQMMADQVAVAIDNANLFGQTQAALEEAQAVHRRYLARAWEQFLAAGRTTRIDYSRPGAEPVDEVLVHEARGEALNTGRTVAVGGTSPDSSGEHASSGAALVVPLRLRGQVIGTIALQEASQDRPWTAEEIEVAETVAEQFALTVESLRLMDETQRRAMHERLVSEISDQMQRATDMEALMRTAAEELYRLLGASRTYVRLVTEADLASE